MRTLQAVLLLVFAVGLANAGEPLSPKELVRQRGIAAAQAKKERKRLEAAWAEFTSRFVIRRMVPVYSGPYQVGVQVVETPNYVAIEQYRRQLEALVWNSMTDQQKRDMALFIIAKNSGIIAANTGRIANQAGRIADQLEADARNREIERIRDDILGR